MLVGSVKNRISCPSRSSGFTLVELLVVMATVAVLAAIMFPALSKAKEAARISECLSNIRQVGVGLTMYLDQYDSYFPPAVPWGTPGGKNQTANTQDRTVQELLYPYVRNGMIRESDGLYAKAGVFVCPSDTGIPLEMPNGVPVNRPVWKHTGCSYEYYASDQEDWLHWDANPPRIPWTGLAPEVDSGSGSQRIGAPLAHVLYPTKKAVMGDMWFWHMGDEVPVCRVAYRNTLFADGHAERLKGTLHLEARLQQLETWHKYIQVQ